MGNVRDNPEDSIAPSPLPVSGGDAQTGWAFWRLSLVLKEISENLEPHTDKKEQPPCQASAQDALTAGEEGSDSREQG